MRELRYDDNDDAKGVPYLQSLGVKYLMVFTEEAKAQADEASPSSRKLGDESGRGTSTRWPTAISSCRSTTQPVVVNHRGGDQRERNLELGTSWFQHRDEWAAMPADGGPADWQRIDVAVDPTRSDGLAPASPAARSTSSSRPSRSSRWRCQRSRSATSSSATRTCSFDVDQIGVPVLVKISYFPNWHVGGRRGAVADRSEHDGRRADVDRRAPDFERSTLDYFAYVLTFLGIVLLIFMRIRGDVQHANTHPFGSESDPRSVPWDDWDCTIATRCSSIRRHPDAMATRLRRPARAPISMQNRWSGLHRPSRPGRLRPARR